MSENLDISPDRGGEVTLDEEALRAIRNRIEVCRQPSHSEATCGWECQEPHGTPFWGPDDMERLIARLDAAQARADEVQRKLEALRKRIFYATTFDCSAPFVYELLALLPATPPAPPSVLDDPEGVM